MKIKRIIEQHRRDFWADFECEGCGAVVKNMRGYDDTYFHAKVIPKMVCPKCNKTSAECGADYRPLTTKYPDGFQI